MDIVSGIVRIILNPFEAATMLNPIPVLPLVGSTKTVFLLINPAFSASSIMALAILSLTLPAGLKNSTFAMIFPAKLNFSFKLLSSTSGVLPTVSKMFFDTFIFYFL